MPKPPTQIRARSLEELIKKAEKLPTKPEGTICNLFQTTKESKEGGNRYTKTIKIKEGVYVQCFGECRKTQDECTIGIGLVDDVIWISCACLRA